MFTRFTYAAKDFSSRHGIKNSLRALSVCDEAEKIIYKLLRQKITATSCKGKTLSIKTKHFSLASEIRLKEQAIKNELKKQGIVVDTIRCVA